MTNNFLGKGLLVNIISVNQYIHNTQIILKHKHPAMKTRCIAIFLIIIFPALIPESMAQEVSKSKPVFGARFSTCFDFEINSYTPHNLLQYTPALTIDYKNHNFYLGPEYIRFYEPTKSDGNIYNPDLYGVNFGYRHYFNETTRNIRLFGQFNYSVYQIRYTSHRLGYPYTHNYKEIRTKNNVSIGINFELNKDIRLFSGIGIGSYSEFFMFFDDVVITTFIGLDYRF